MSGDPRQATDALAEFAAAVRPDWEAWAVRTAVGEALHAGWTWKLAVHEVIRLLWVPTALPGDLVPAATTTAQAVPLPKDRVHQHAEAARAGLPKGGGT